jgi:thiamine-monophosphate kinase
MSVSMQLSTTTEESITRWLSRQPRCRPSSRLRLGIGDDCAVLRPMSSLVEIVLTTDQLIENKHFIMSRHPAGALCRKLLARGLSDIAAMGAEPTWLLLSLGLPEWANDGWLEHFFDEMFQSIEAFNPQGELRLAGGDLSAAERFTAHVTAGGEAPAGRVLTRSGARPGDRLYVSGSLGGSSAGLEKVLAGAVDPSDPATDRHLRPTPRSALGVALRETGATAAIDISDGLSSDLARLAGASAVQAVIEMERVPVFEGASIRQALHGGEEYELLFTAPPESRIPSRMAGVAITPIGEMVAGDGVLLSAAGELSPLAPQGFDHFRD